MFISCDTLDDLLRAVFQEIIYTGDSVKPTRGSTKELMGVLLELKNPRARLSRTETKGNIYSAIGEFLWYISGDNDLEFIAYYLKRYRNDSEDGKTIYGGYGPRLFSMHGEYNQIANVLSKLKENPHSRKAVIQLFDAKDIGEDHKEIPCTCTLQFLARNGKLFMFTYMRSNDAYFGLPHDVFAFTMLQELLARHLSLEIGSYRHMVGSLHLYDDRISDAQKFISEGWQPTDLPMPAMPYGDQLPALEEVCATEKLIRETDKIILPTDGLSPYWKDIIYLLSVYKHQGNKDFLQLAKKQISSNNIYDVYIDKIAGRKKPRSTHLPQLPFEDISKATTIGQIEKKDETN